MNKKELIEMIREEIDSAVVDTLKHHASNVGGNTQKQAFKPRGLSEEEIDSIIFHGGRKPESDKYFPITIKEVDEKSTKILKSEIDEFENKFKEKIPNATIIFDKQRNGFSMMLLKKPDGVEAITSGTINVGTAGKITWSFSILNGIQVTAVNFKLGQDNKTLFQDLYEFYKSWENEWRMKLTDSGAGNNEIIPGSTDMGLPAQATMGQPGAVVSPGSGVAPGTAPAV